VSELAEEALQVDIGHAINVSYAGLWRRGVAFALDYLVIAAYLALVAGAGLGANALAPSLLPALFAERLSAHATAFVLVTLPVSLYFALLESSRWRATWGKRVMRLCVVRADGGRVGVGQALGRTALTFIPWELAHTLIWQIRFAPATPSALVIGGFVLVWALVGMNIASLALRANHQSLADWMAGTYVIDR
jgi:uncharacterized RDD family membrane protein YckC